jgi:hypothetical protein
MKALLVIFSLVLPILMFGETLNRQEVCLSKNKLKVSLVEITETHKGNRTTIVADTIKNLYPSENAKAYMTQRNAEILMNESYMVWLPDSLVPRKTHLFGKDTYERYTLEVVGNKIFLCCKGYYYKPINKGIFYFTFIFSLLFLAVSLLGGFASKTRGMIVALRRTIIIMFVIFSLLFFGVRAFTFIDSFTISLIAMLPSFITTFLFKKRIERLETKK